MADRKTLSTIGYEGASLNDFIATLIAAEIKCLVDVREIAISRRKGFAKTALSQALAKAGIEYVHLKGLGDPKLGREAARQKDYETFRRIFSQHLRSEVAKTDLNKATAYAQSGHACLMCFERDFHYCHREMVASALSDQTSLKIRHLGVKAGLAKNGREPKQSGARKGISAR